MYVIYHSVVAHTIICLAVWWVHLFTSLPISTHFYPFLLTQHFLFGLLRFFGSHFGCVRACEVYYDFFVLCRIVSVVVDFFSFRDVFGTVFCDCPALEALWEAFDTGYTRIFYWLASFSPFVVPLLVCVCVYEQRNKMVGNRMLFYSPLQLLDSSSGLWCACVIIIIPSSGHSYSVCALYTFLHVIASANPCMPIKSIIRRMLK